ncbi:hypothetical protein ACFRAQ_02390 [Nocardia sp. NPDC056611]|uniref:hypothetical protein n=1 Tax=unclassified Nocardia TaxID=2637762 RepID=UPI00366DED21
MKNIRRVGFSAAGIAAVSAAIALTAPIASATNNDCGPGTTTPPPTTTTPPKTTTPSTGGGGFDSIIKSLGTGSAANSNGIGASVS